MILIFLRSVDMRYLCSGQKCGHGDPYDGMNLLFAHDQGPENQLFGRPINSNRTVRRPFCPVPRTRWLGMEIPVVGQDN